MEIKMSRLTEVVEIPSVFADWFLIVIRDKNS